MIERQDTPSRFAPDRLLEAWSLYRIGIAGALLLLLNSSLTPPNLLADARSWLQIVLMLSMLAGALLLVANRSRRLAVLPLVSLHLLSDLATAALASYASGGMEGGLGSMFILPVAMGGLFLPRSAAPVPAALASLLLLAIEYRQQEVQLTDGAWAAAGLLGGLLFLVAVLAHTFAQRARLDEQIAHLASTSLGQMRKLAAEVVERMQSAVVVTDLSGHVLLSNAASHGLLLHARDRRNLREREPELWEAAEVFRMAPEQAEFTPIRLRSGAVVWPHFVHLSGDPSLLLVVVDDPARIEKQNQQARMATLGQVTAGVAHDLRNPLAALTSAVQLLQEEPDQDVGQLLGVIQRQSRRLNRVVERVYDLAQPIRPRAEILNLTQFLEEWLADQRRSGAIPENGFESQIPPTLPNVILDPDHLAEVLSNLTDNAFQHARPPAGEIVRARLDVQQSGERLSIRLQDNGTQPLQPDTSAHFAPFSGEGPMGLGLTLCKELIEANGGDIRFCLPDTQQGWKGTCVLLGLPLAGAKA